MDEKENKFVEGFKKTVGASEEKPADPFKGPNAFYYENAEEGRVGGFKNQADLDEKMKSVTKKYPNIEHKVYYGGQLNKTIPASQPQPVNKDVAWLKENASRINKYMDEKEKIEAERKLKYNPKQSDAQMKEGWKDQIQNLEIYNRLSKILGVEKDEIINSLNKQNDPEHKRISYWYNKIKELTPRKSDIEAHEALNKSENEFLKKEDDIASSSNIATRFNKWLEKYNLNEDTFEQLPKEKRDEYFKEFSDISHNKEHLNVYDKISSPTPEQPKPVQSAPVQEQPKSNQLGSKLFGLAEQYKNDPDLNSILPYMKDYSDSEIDDFMKSNPDIANKIGYDKIKGGK